MAKGFKTGGRQKGTPNKRSVEVEAAAAGELPRDYMLRIMRDPEADDHRRDEMAKAVAPYVHGKITDGHGMNVNIAGEYTNGKDTTAELAGIRVEFVKPRHVDE